MLALARPYFSLPRNASVIQSFFSPKYDIESSAKLISRQSHDLMIGILEERLSRGRDFDVIRQSIALTEVTKLTKFPFEGPLICSWNSVDPFRPTKKKNLKFKLNNFLFYFYVDATTSEFIYL